jgi:hypothetical protein
MARQKKDGEKRAGGGWNSDAHAPENYLHVKDIKERLLQECIDAVRAARAEGTASQEWMAELDLIAELVFRQTGKAYKREEIHAVLDAAERARDLVAELHYPRTPQEFESMQFAIFGLGQDPPPPLLDEERRIGMRPR